MFLGKFSPPHLQLKTKRTPTGAMRLLLQLAILVPLGAGRFHVGGILCHTLTAFHVEIRDVPVPLPHFLFRKGLNPAASALRAAGFYAVPFFCHIKPPFCCQCSQVQKFKVERFWASKSVTPHMNAIYYKNIIFYFIIAVCYKITIREF